MKPLIMLLLFFLSISFATLSFAQEVEYKGTQKFLTGIGAEYDAEKLGFDIEYVLEGELANFITFNSTLHSISFEYDSKGIAEDVLIIYLPHELIKEPLVVYVNGEKEPDSILFTNEDTSEMIIPLFEDSKVITIVGVKVISETDGGGCLIATATYGSELAPQVQQLRELRDNSLLQTESGSEFIGGFNQFYYSFSPTIADWERQNPAFKEVVRTTITPLILSLSILNNVDMDSEEKVLGYGIGIILLNIGMYFVAPTVVILKIKKQLEINQFR